MNITIIYGTTKKSTTYSCVQLLLNNLMSNINVQITEFYLTEDLNKFSYLYSLYNKNKCNPFNNMNYITKSLTNSDLIIFACPLVDCDISNNIKTFLSHLIYKSIVNKTSSLMNNKIGLIMATTPGAGLFRATRILKKELNLLGIGNIFSFSKSFYELDWEHVNLKTKKQVNKKLFRISNNILSLYHESQYPTVLPKHKLNFLQKNLDFNKYPNVINLNYFRNNTYLHSKDV